MSPRWALTDLEQLGFPRVSGDEPSSPPPVFQFVWFSPRERG